MVWQKFQRKSKLTQIKSVEYIHELKDIDTTCAKFNRKKMYAKNIGQTI